MWRRKLCRSTTDAPSQEFQPEEERGGGGKEDRLDSPADAQMGRMTDRWTERRED